MAVAVLAELRFIIPPLSATPWVVTEVVDLVAAAPAKPLAQAAQVNFVLLPVLVEVVDGVRMADMVRMAGWAVAPLVLPGTQFPKVEILILVIVILAQCMDRYYRKNK